MIKVVTAYTTEVDEIEDGINEICGQIDPGELKTNSVGLITCHYDFIQTGFVSELQKRLSFDVIGMTTLASGNDHGYGMYSLSLTILTSDDVSFETAMSDPLDTDNYNEKIPSLYNTSRQKHESDVTNCGGPAMIITFCPIPKDLAGAVMLRTLDDTANGIPIWGSLVTNYNVSYEKYLVFRNGEAVQDAMVLLLLYGKIDPDFIVISIPEQKISESRGMITESEGCLLKTINQMPAAEYLKSIGVELIENALTAIPMMVYYEGNTKPVALGIYTILEDDSLLCGGEVTEGSVIAVGEITAQGILSTTDEGIKKLLETGKNAGALILPCVTRYIMLSPDKDSELELISNSMAGKMPFLMGYSGGEICPVRDEFGILHNRFHNYTFCACIF